MITTPEPLRLDSDALRLVWDGAFGALLLDARRQIVAVNRVFLDWSGYPEARLLGSDAAQLVPPEDHPSLPTEASPPRRLHEFRILDAQRRERWCRGTAHRLQDDKGRPLLLWLLQDTTAEHVARTQADRSVHELDHWFALSPSGLVLFDDDGLLLRGNPAFEALCGGPRVTLAEAPEAVRELLGWNSRATTLATLEPGAAPLVRELSIGQPEGQPLRLRALLRNIGETGGRRRIMAVIEDRSLEDERDLARMQVGALVDTAGLGLATFQESVGWMRDSKGAPAALATRDGPALQAIGRDIVEPASVADYERLQQALRQGQRAEVRYAVRHPEIGQRWLLTRVEPGQLKSGHRTTAVVTLDVTEQERSRKSNEQLLHELTTILESTTTGMAYLRGDVVVRCNRRFERMLRRTEGSLAGAAVGELLDAHPQARELIEEALKAIEDGVLYETEFPLGDRGSLDRWYSLSVRRVGTASREAIAVLTDISRLKAQQSELERLARDREVMFSLSGVGIAYLQGSRIERANAALAELTGYRSEELVGLDHARLFEDRAEYLRIIAQQRASLARRGYWSGERALRCRDGSLMWVQVSLRAVLEGQPQGDLIASYVSVDDRRRAQESLVRQAEHTRAILDSVLVGIVTVDASGIEWMNRSARRMFGGELSDFLGQPMSVVATTDPEHPFRHARRLDDQAVGEAHTFECQIRARDGRQFWIAGNVVVTGHAQTGRQLTYALLDIDRRRQAEAKSAQSQASLQRIIESAPLAISLREVPALRVLQMNQLAAQMLGRSVAECLGKAPEELYPTEIAVAMRADMEAALGSTEMTQREYSIEQQGRVHLWDARYLPLATGTVPRVDQLLLVATDVTDQREAERSRLEAAIAQREMLVREVHHRIKNNLQGVAGLLQQSALRHPEVAGVIGEAVGQVQAIAQVYGLQVGSTGPLRVKSVIEAIIGAVQRNSGRPITLGVNGEAHRWALSEAESIPIALVVNELLSNAVKHSDAAAGQLRCLLHFDEQLVRVSVGNPGRLPDGFDVQRVPGGVSGLGLVRALLPRRSARLSITQSGPEVLASIELMPPGVTRLTPL